MYYFLLFLRLVHIVGGVFWVGAALVMAFFIAPAIGATAEAGQKFMGYLLTQSRFAATMMIAAIATVVTGTIHYWIASNGFTSAWMGTGPGIGFGLGGVFALVGFVSGIVVSRTSAAMAKLAAQFKGPPTPDQQAQMAVLRKRQLLASTVNAYALIIATALMAMARYLRY